MRIAIIQHRPVYLDLAASLQKAKQLMAEAASKNVDLIVFGETWLCGYPAWLDHCPGAALWDHPSTKEVFSQMHHSSIDIKGSEVQELGKMAGEYRVHLVMGVNERVNQGPGTGTLFNSLLTFAPNGQLVNHHRKLMPTYTEKLLYGLGDGHGLHSTQTDWGQLGGLICWEHWMPHARQALHNAGEHVHVAVWPTVTELHQLASRHYAIEGRCFVIAAGQILACRDLPDTLELAVHLQGKPDHLLLKGGSCVIDPKGAYVMPPVMDEEGILFTEIDPTAVYPERMTLDVSGHYQRSDIFSFQVNRERK